MPSNCCDIWELVTFLYKIFHNQISAILRNKPWIDLHKNRDVNLIDIFMSTVIPFDYIGRFVFPQTYEKCQN